MEEAPAERDRSRSPKRDNGKLNGTVLRWNEKGFGFIRPEIGGEDIFCHTSNIEDGDILEKGAEVQYVKVVDQKNGKPRAEQVTGGTTGAKGGQAMGNYVAAAPNFAGKSIGSVLRWNDKGFGFIKPDDGSEDLFCHSSNIDDGDSLTPGSKVGFVKVFDERKGKDRAEQVVGGTRAGAGGYGGAPPPGGGYGGGYGGQPGYAPPPYGGGYPQYNQSPNLTLRSLQSPVVSSCVLRHLAPPSPTASPAPPPLDTHPGQLRPRATAATRRRALDPTRQRPDMRPRPDTTRPLRSRTTAPPLVAMGTAMASRASRPQVAMVSHRREARLRRLAIMAAALACSGEMGWAAAPISQLGTSRHTAVAQLPPSRLYSAASALKKDTRVCCTRASGATSRVCWKP